MRDNTTVFDSTKVFGVLVISAAKYPRIDKTSGQRLFILIQIFYQLLVKSVYDKININYRNFA